MPGALSRTISIRIDSKLIIALTLVSGLVGVMLSLLFKKSGQHGAMDARKIVAALVVGETAAVLVILLYVFKIVRKFESPVVHSMLSVPLVACAGALSGWSGISLVLDKLGLGFGEKKKPPNRTLAKGADAGSTNPDSRRGAPVPPAPGDKDGGGSPTDRDSELDAVSKLIDEAVGELPELELPLALAGSEYQRPSAETEAKFGEADKKLRALFDLIELVRDRKRLAAGFVKIASFHRYVGEYQTAIDRLEVAIQLDGENALSHEALGETLSYRANEQRSSPQEKAEWLDRAERALIRALDLRRTAPWAETFHALAWLYDERGAYGKAIANYRKAKQAVKRVSGASYYHYSYNLACALTKAGEFAEAFAELKTVLGNGSFALTAERDPDLDPLRSSALGGALAESILDAKRKQGLA